MTMDKKRKIKVDLSLSISTTRYLDMNPECQIKGEYTQEQLFNAYLKMDKNLKTLLQSEAWFIDDYNFILQKHEDI